MTNGKSFSSGIRIPPPNNTKTLRDEIAIEAMCAYIHSYPHYSPGRISTIAYDQADAMLKARSSEPSKK